MGNTIQQILAALTTFPGNLVYHMALAFSIAGAFQAALSLWRDSDFPQGRRMAIGLGALLGIRFLLFLVAGLAQQGLANPHVILPLMDRSAMILSTIIILWLWIFPEPERIFDAASGIIGVLALMITGLSWIWWSGHYSETAFNSSWLDLGWEFFAVVLLILGIALLLLRRPNGWEYGLGMMLTLTLGHILHLIIPVADNDFPGFVRLAEMSAYPILFSLPRRFSTTPAETPLIEIDEPTPKQTQPIIQERQQYGVAPERLQTFLGMISETSVRKLCTSIARTVAETMLADICLLLYPPSGNGQFVIQCGYDLIREETLGNITIDQDKLPLLSTAMSKARPLRLPSSSTSRDLTTIGEVLGLGNTGHMLAGFVTTPEGDPYLGILLLSPHSDRRWSRVDQNYMEQITRGLAPFLHRSKKWSAAQEELEKTQANLQTFQTMLEDAQSENEELKTMLSTISENGFVEIQKEITTEKIEPTIDEAQLEELAKLKDEHKNSLDSLSRLQVENRRLGEMVESLISKADTSELTTSGQLRKELKQALEEIAHLKNQLATVEQEVLQSVGETTDAVVMSDEQMEVFASIAQDLRQPMSSILGYTDLLIGESVGILGALQRKFLERIRASTERMEMLLDDLLRITTLNGDQFQLNPEAVDLGSAIDKALADTSAQMRDKKITLRLDLPNEMPNIHADRDALQQILIHLLKNAGSVSPIEGEIFLRADIQASETDRDFVLIQVADQGGGIPEEELPRVFSRLYRADNPLIEGVGDTGVGLSIVKTLVESHDGRIWVDSEIGKGSAFNLILPLYDGITSQNEQGQA